MNHIPPIQCLVTFEAVARLRSASRAADELCVTVSAWRWCSWPGSSSTGSRSC
jgi:hypothetical protein